MCSFVSSCTTVTVPSSWGVSLVILPDDQETILVSWILSLVSLLVCKTGIHTCSLFFSMEQVCGAGQRVSGVPWGKGVCTATS